VGSLVWVKFFNGLRAEQEILRKCFSMQIGRCIKLRKVVEIRSLNGVIYDITYGFNELRRYFRRQSFHNMYILLKDMTERFKVPDCSQFVQIFKFV